MSVMMSVSVMMLMVMVKVVAMMMVPKLLARADPSLAPAGQPGEVGRGKVRGRPAGAGALGCTILH